MHDCKYTEYKDSPGMLNKEDQDYHLTIKITAATNQNKDLEEILKSLLYLWCYLNSRVQM